MAHASVIGGVAVDAPSSRASWIAVERLGWFPALWGLGILGAFAPLLLGPPGGALPVGDDDRLTGMAFLGVGALLVAWDVIRRWRRVELHVRGGEIEVRRRGALVAACPIRAVRPWPVVKNASDLGRGVLIAMRIALQGGLIVALAPVAAVTGVAMLAASALGVVALLDVQLRHWTVELPRGRGTLTITLRRRDVRRLLDGEGSTRRFGDVIRAARAVR
jgi:hypothetical protein